MTLALQNSTRLFGCVLFLGLGAPWAAAHPVPRDDHDRTVVVKLEKSNLPNQIRIRVEYRLELDETTVLKDMEPFKDVANWLDYRGEPLKYYAQFTKIYAPVLAERLSASDNQKPIAPFRCVARRERLEDEDGKPLGHLRCDFVFESEFVRDPRQKSQFEFWDQNYHGQPGKLDLTLVNETGIEPASKTVPDDALRSLPIEKLGPEEEDRLRKIAVLFVPNAAPAPPVVDATGSSSSQAPALPARKESVANDSGSSRVGHHDAFSLTRLLLHTDYGVWLTVLLAFLIGAAHALTPGHGKTLVAAYLVGERGTVWHAAFLGVVTTVTHTGAVLILAVVMVLVSDDMKRQLQTWIEHGAGLVVGLIVTCMGVWLLLQRLTGRPDHVHLDGGHHHHHDHASPPSARSLSWWGLVVLGVTGGMIPCWDAVFVLCITVGSSAFWLVLPAVLAFSAGLAVVLVMIGILVVQVPRLAESRWGSDRLVRWLPIVSAVVVTLMGLWLCKESSQW
jgi:ABC-type nickel/cobalt efflux system permease component RcnA